MKVLLVYYTGTFNTRYLCEKIKSRFVLLGDQVDLVEINSTTPVVNTFEYDLIGFSYPIYGFNSPAPFNKYVKKLKFRSGQKYFIIKNSGETFAMNNASSRILLRFMKRRKVEFIGEYHLVMPYNIHFRFEEDFIREIFAYNEKLLDVAFYNFKHKIVERIKSNFIYNIAAFFVGIQKIGGNVNSFLYTVDDKKCIKCMKCVKECPHENVYVKKGKIKFHHHCDMCMRCSFFCPTNAIKIGFLEGWKVNGAYEFDRLEKLGPPKEPYITEKSKGFYKCFVKYFSNVDKAYENIFGDKKNDK